VGSCLNKTTSAPIRKAIIANIRTDIGPTTIFANEVTLLKVLTSDPHFTDEGMTGVTNSPTEQESSRKPLEASVVIYVPVLSVVILVVVLVIFVFRWIMKKRSSLYTEYDSVQHEQQNLQQQKSCDVCPIYENYTPNCAHKISGQNKNKRKKGELNFATQLTLETYETILGEETEESCLYSAAKEEESTQYIDSNNDSDHSSYMLPPVPRNEVKQIEHNI
jgi:hypothetical protein